MRSRRGFIKLAGVLTAGMLLPEWTKGKSINSNMRKENQYDVIIVGGSYSGLAAGMALGRALRKVLIIDSGDPCNKQTPHSHNFLTNDGKAPGEIAAFAKKELSRYHTVELVTGWAITASKTEDGFTVQMQDGGAFSARKLILATGINDIMPGIPGFADCWGISVLHCPYCHGYEVRQQKTGVFANGDLAYEMASLVSNWTNDLTIYTNGPSTLNEQQRTKLEHHGIDIVDTEIERLEHKMGYVERIIFKNKTSVAVKTLYARLPFKQHSAIAHMLGCEITPEGYIKIDATNKTTVHGLYACGDNASRMRTVANAVSMGTTTGIMVNKELIEENF